MSDRELTTDRSNEFQTSEMKELRKLLLGNDYQVVREVLKAEGRGFVSDVLTEALHDRQKADGSVSGVLTPLVEKSVESAVVARKKQFISYLYPLVGGLVRKAVSSSLAEILEKTNELLESSFTIKGLRWRFEARRAGISYSQYVIRQTFEFRVEQVLLIHRDAGLLLRSVVHDTTQAADGDMFSGMLTAINDFVSDSFSQSEGEQNLDEIKTDDFTLILKQGPKAILVAAITGKPPANISDKLQLTLESIHQIYHDELSSFEGDAAVFENVDQQLNTCLIAEQKEPVGKNQKKPWLAIIFLTFCLCVLGFVLSKHWYFDFIANKVSDLNAAPGIVLLSAERCADKICLDVLRDPIAESVASWVSGVVPDEYDLNIREQAYRSLDSQLLPTRLGRVAESFSELDYVPEISKFKGVLSRFEYEQINTRLSSMPEAPLLADVLSEVKVSETVVESDLLKRFTFEQAVAEIKDIQIDFEVDASSLSKESTQLLDSLSDKVIEANTVSTELGYTFLLLIMGVSTDSGTATYNQRLNYQRVKAVEAELIKNGVQPEYMSLIDIGSLSERTPQVTFDVVTLPTENLK